MLMTEAPHAHDARSPSRWRRLASRMGKFATLFFFLKGLAWLAVPALIAWFGRG